MKRRSSIVNMKTWHENFPQTNFSVEREIPYPTTIFSFCTAKQEGNHGSSLEQCIDLSSFLAIDSVSLLGVSSIRYSLLPSLTVRLFSMEICLRKLNWYFAKTFFRINADLSWGKIRFNHLLRWIYTLFVKPKENNLTKNRSDCLKFLSQQDEDIGKL